jgi:hypothetical protein
LPLDLPLTSILIPEEEIVLTGLQRVTP